MKTGRDKKVAEEIRREVSQILHFELGNPRVQGATVTSVRMTPDLKLARVYFAMPGCEERSEEAQSSLQKSASYIRKLIADRIVIKYMPKIEFFYDDSLELESKIDELFRNIPVSREVKESE